MCRGHGGRSRQRRWSGLPALRGHVSVFLAQLLNGLQYGLLLFLIASGLTLIFGVLRVINLAHGSLFMMGAYAAFLVVRTTGSLWLALPVAIVAGDRARPRCSSASCSATSTSASISTRCCSPSR